MLRSANTRVGQLPLAEQSLEGTCQLGEAVSRCSAYAIALSD